MPFVQFNSAIAGHDFDYKQGDIVDWPDEKEVVRMEERGIAERLTADVANARALREARTVRIHKHRPAPQFKY
jgi:hypothetical protein